MIESVLNLLKDNREKHALFLNSLSVLEYAGARKIMKSQRAETLTLETLTHISEELRHARLLKNLALQLSGGILKTYEKEHLLCGSATWDYIQSVDASVEKDLAEKAEPWLNYVYTTLLIEERAMKVYPLYEPVLKGFGFSNPLAGLIAEEEHHLHTTRKAVIEADKDNGVRLRRLESIELQSFTRFMEEICQTFKSDQKCVNDETFSPH